MTADGDHDRALGMRRSTAVLTVGLALALTACQQDAPEIEAGAEPDDTAAEAPAEPDGAATVATAGTDLGEVLVDADGMTLYLFDPDEQGESTCYDECADNWPPLLAEEDPVAGDGVDADLLGTTERDDGTTQVTYDGWPLYLWVGDQEPGDVTGQGVEDVWWVLQPDGTPVRDAADGEADDDGADTGY